MLHVLGAQGETCKDFVDACKMPNGHPGLRLNLQGVLQVGHLLASFCSFMSISLTGTLSGLQLSGPRDALAAVSCATCWPVTHSQWTESP